MQPAKDKRRRVRQAIAGAVLIILVLVLVITFNGAMTSPTPKATVSSQTTQPTQFANSTAWREYMSKATTPQAGCFEATYPSTELVPVKCGPPPKPRLMLPGSAAPQPLEVGNLVDYSAQPASSTPIGVSSGSFVSVSGLSTENDVCVAPYVSMCEQANGGSDGAGSNEYTLQDNSQQFQVNTAYTGNIQATVEEQFAFSNDPGGAYGGPQVVIQYWLLNYQGPNRSCPGTGIPDGGGSWINPAPGECVADSYVTPVTLPQSELSPSNLANLLMVSEANFHQSGYDQVGLCPGGTVSSANCFYVSEPINVLDLNLNWREAEFNIFGFQSGSQAVFNTGTTLTVSNSLLDGNGDSLLPSCSSTGATLESSNLNLGYCGGGAFLSGQMLFVESNAVPQPLTTEVVKNAPPNSGSGTITPSCPPVSTGGNPASIACPEPVGSFIDITAYPNPGSQLEGWQIQGATCQGPPFGYGSPLTAPITNQCEFVMPDAEVWVTAEFSSAAPFGFAISTPGIQYALQGESVTIPFTVTATYGTQQPVDLSLSSQPQLTVDYPKISWSPSSTVTPSPGQGTSVTLAIPTDCVDPAVGQYSLTITGTQSGAQNGVTASSNPFTLSVSSSSKCEPPEPLTTSIVGSGSVQPNCPVPSADPAACEFAPGFYATVTESPAPNWVFGGWTLSGTPHVPVCLTGYPSNTCQFIMPPYPVGVTANFIYTLVTVKVSYAVIGGGNPAAPTFNYVGEGGLPQSLALPRAPAGGQSSPATLTVLASSHWYITNPLPGSPFAEQWVTSQMVGTFGAAAFGGENLIINYQHQFRLSVSVDGPPSCSVFCSVSTAGGWYDPGTAVNIKASSDGGYKFTGWTGTYTGTALQNSFGGITVTMNSAVTETANFSAPASNPPSSGYQSAAPSLTLTPTSGPDGTTVTFSGSGFSGSSFAPGCTITSSSGGLMSSHSCFYKDGKVSGGFAVAGNALTGTYTVTVTSSTGDSASAKFTVTAAGYQPYP